MPTLSLFNGILIKMNKERGAQHHKPHLHAVCAEYDACANMETDNYFDYVGVDRARPLDDKRIEVVYRNGMLGVFDCAPYFKDPFWKKLSEPAFFNQVRVEGGTLTWPNDIDIAPEEVWHQSVKSCGA